MDDIIKNLIQSQPKSLSIHIIREFLQIHPLYCLSKSKYGKNLDEILSIKFEIDTAPNPESKFSSAVINKYNLLFPVLRSDLPSMMAGKICAIFKRGYRLGRDFYDLGWYLTRRIEPNYKYLEKELGIKNKQVLEEHLLDLFTKIDWEKLMAEVKPFLIKKEELFLYSQLDKVLKDYIQEVA